MGIRGCSHEGSFDEATHQLQNRRVPPTLEGTDMGMGKPVTPTCLNKAMLQIGDTLAGLGGSQESPRSTVCPGSCPASKEPPPHPTPVAICVEPPPGMGPLKGPSPMSGHSHWSSKSPGGFHKLKLHEGNTNGKWPEGCEQPHSLLRVENEQRESDRGGGTEGIPVEFDSPELPLLL